MAWLPIIAITLTATIFAFAILSLWLGICGKRIDDHPVCRKCKYDLLGIKHKLTTPQNLTCPECGSPLSSQRAITTGNRHKRKPLIYLAITFFLLLATSTAITLLYSDLSTYKPAWYLRLEARNPDLFPASDKSLGELVSRLNSNQLSTVQIKAAFYDAVYMIDQKHIPWKNNWGDIIYITLRKQTADQTMQDAYMNAILNSLEVKWRHTIPNNGILPIEYAMPTNHGTSQHLMFTNQYKLIINGMSIYQTPSSINLYSDNRITRSDLLQLIAPNIGPISTRTNIAMPHNIPGMFLSHTTPTIDRNKERTPIPISLHDVTQNTTLPTTLDFEIEISATCHSRQYYGLRSGRPHRRSFSTNTKGTKRHKGTLTITSHKQAASLIKTLQNIQLQNKVTNSITKAKIYNRGGEWLNTNNQSWILLNLFLKKTPMNIAYDVYLRSQNTEHKIANILLRKHTIQYPHQSQIYIPAKINRTWIDQIQTADIILKPSKIKTFEFSDQWEIPGEPIIIKNVPITKR
ncbi:hypothetical protein [Poriferisphaera sp. WC338]|uniref:hypothetical protein n=1 Tax=Poriferisphaera sp. WC338 TaxID=3425129 RepID=UPI003D8132D2